MDVILKKYFWVFNLLVIALCATLAGRAAASMVVSAVLTGDGPPSHARTAPAMPPSEAPHLKDADAILKRNIFCSTCAPIVPVLDVQSESQPTDLTPQKSSLQLQLVATLVVPDDPPAVPRPPRPAKRERPAGPATKGRRSKTNRTAMPMPLVTVTSEESPSIRESMAVIRDLSSDKKPVAGYRRGDQLPQGAVLAQVVEGRIYIVVGKSIQFINQTDAPPPVAVAVAEPNAASPEASALDKDIEKGVRCNGSNCEVDKSLIDKVLANTTALATSARFVPSSKDGKPNGFKVYAIRPGSVFAKIGMQNADLIKGINGLDMSTPDKAFEAYTKLKSASHLTVQLERRGDNITLDYQIR
jgi:general secretion pathway protein C